MTEQQIPKLAASLVEHQASFTPLSVEDAQWVIQNTVEAIGLFLRAVYSRAKIYLRRLYEAEAVFVPAMDGTETPEQLAELFPGGIYGDAKAVSTASSPTATPKMVAKVYEMVEDGAFKPVFESLGAERRRWASLYHVAAFCRTHPEKLRGDGFGTFFEMEGGFVADVRVEGDGRLRVYVDPFERDRVWRAGYCLRVVVSQLVA